MNGAEYIAEFLSRRGVRRVFLLTGGACAFMVDAVARHAKLSYVCCHHEQAAAMAADASWRASGVPGVSMATSGPGATNLLTGIACSYFDSIPSLHITGQVNKAESAAFPGAKVRQAGFQETDIVAMARPITKYAVQVDSVEALRRELPRAWDIATSGRMGPVLIDVPMNVQKDEAGEMEAYAPPAPPSQDVAGPAQQVSALLKAAQRPLVLLGAGVGLAGVQDEAAAWLAGAGLPFVASWNGMGYVDSREPGYLGNIGVYGNRGANIAVQNCDALLVLGSRLDNRQRSGHAPGFAPKAKVLVVDVDGEELKKYAAQDYGVAEMNLVQLPRLLAQVSAPAPEREWLEYVLGLKARFYGTNDSSFAAQEQTLSPYAVVRALQKAMAEDAIVTVDTGAALCWVYQAFERTRHTLFAANGMSPMGYALPAAISAKLAMPEKQVLCCAGDGGFQLNLQELQVVAAHGLAITLVVFNNGGYGIIKQFQDAYLGGRHAATGEGYSVPELRRIAEAYGLDYTRVGRLSQIHEGLLAQGRARIVEVALHPNTLIEPKLEMGRPLHDQFPYLDRADLAALNPYAEGSNGP